MSSAPLHLMPPFFLKCFQNSIWRTDPVSSSRLEVNSLDRKVSNLLFVFLSFFFFCKPVFSQTIINSFLPFRRQLLTVCISATELPGLTVLITNVACQVQDSCSYHSPPFTSLGNSIRALICSHALGLFVCFFLASASLL